MRPLTMKLWRDPAIESALTLWNAPGAAARPAMLVVPGGGYGNVCVETEGIPIAQRFAELGFQAFYLQYRVKPHRFPAPQQDILRAIRLIRANAAAWGVRKNEVAVCGFSAGGHLCASAGTIWREIDADDGDDADRESGRPDAMILSYPVIALQDESFQNLLGDRYGELKERLYLQNRVTDETPPAFLWHTFEDTLCPPENSMLFAAALRERHIPVELHLFPKGPHGMTLGCGRCDIAGWPRMAKNFLYGTCGFRFPEEKRKRTVVLTFDDACRTQLENAVPVLREYGFGATFFPCRFPDAWRAEHGAALMDGAELRQLHDLGFEIGNHTWSHPDLRKLSESEIAAEIGKMNEFLAAAGIPAPVSFAYPGGPFAENAVPALKKLGFRCARTTEQSAWTPGETDPMRLPAFGLNTVPPLDSLNFYRAVSHAAGEKIVTLLYHGTPDTVHPWVNTEAASFREQMKYLHDNDFEVISLRDALGRA